MAASALFDEADGRGRAAAGGKHRVEDNQFTFLRVGGKLAVVFHGVQRHGIAVEADVTDAAGRNQVRNAVHHAQTSAQNRHDAQLLAREYLRLHLADGRFNLDFLSGQVASDFVDHQRGDFFQQFAEFLGSRFLLAHDGQLMLNQRMVENVYLTHGDASFIFSEGTRVAYSAIIAFSKSFCKYFCRFRKNLIHMRGKSHFYPIRYAIFHDDHAFLCC